MPTYEFRCPKGHDFEKFYKTISAAPTELACPECGAVATRQLSGGAGLLFKGSGFYLTDYGKNAHRKPAPDSKPSKGEGATSEGTSGKSEGTKSEGSKSGGGERSSGSSSSGTSEGSSRSSPPSAGPASPKPKSE